MSPVFKLGEGKEHHSACIWSGRFSGTCRTQGAGLAGLRLHPGLRSRDGRQELQLNMVSLLVVWEVIDLVLVLLILSASKLYNVLSKTFTLNFK